MDYGMNELRSNSHPQNNPPVGFTEQLRDFLRRNLNWLLIGGFTLLLVQDVFGTHGVLAMRRSLREAAQAQKEINQLSEENRQLEDRVQRLKTDPAAIERIAREDMGLARPGEYIFKIPPKAEGPTPPTTTTGSPKKP